MNAHYDIAVIGSGAAGIAAAICAGRTKRPTILLDKNSAPGGTGGCSGLTTLCGFYDEEGNFLNEGFTREFADAITEAPSLKMGRVWVLPYRPEKFRAVAQKFLMATFALETRWNTPLADVVVENDCIVSLNGFNIGAVIDCSGDAEVARAIGAECLATDETTQASAVVFSLHHVTCALSTPADIAQVLLPLARAGFPPVHFQTNLEPGSLTVKFSGEPGQVPQLLDHLRGNVRGFEKCSTSVTEFTISRRAGRMIVGRHVLNGCEVLAGKKFGVDSVRCAWPMEKWNAKGEVCFRYLPPGSHYEIPGGSLRAARFKNLFMAGKTISADLDAIASARVMGCGLATGAAAGKLAANYLDSDTQK